MVIDSAKLEAQPANLFTGHEGFEDLDRQLREKEARKRGSYNTNKDKTIKFVSLYDELQFLYKEISHYFCQSPFFNKEETFVFYDFIKVHSVIYENEPYFYEYDYFNAAYADTFIKFLQFGLEVSFNTTICLALYTLLKYEYCEGDFFQYREAEIIGSELLDVEDRIALHRQFLDDLNSGVTIELVITRAKKTLEEMRKCQRKLLGYK